MGIFEPFRAIGYISDNTPFSIQRRGLDTFVIVSVGKAWQILNCSKLSLVFVGSQLEKSIRALASFQEFTYAATGRNIAVFHRAHQVSVWRAHSNKVNILLEYGHYILSIDTRGHVCIWDAGESKASNPKPIGEFHLPSSFTPSCVMHPDTYLDKVLIGSEEGLLQLWNIKSKKMIYEFKGWNSPVRTCVPSPALDVVGIGCGDGKIYVHNIRYHETVTTFTHTTKGPVTALSFRTDGQPFLAAGGSSGVISIWHLEKRKLQTVIKDAHDSEIASLHFLANEPVLLSNSRDNSLKMWIFDSFDGEARLLRYRSGHSAPPTCIRYYGDGKCLLSAGQDRAFRLFSTIQDQQSRELSQGHISKRAKKLQVKEEDMKLAPIVAFDAAEIRERDWCNVVTCHLDDCAAYTWRLQNFVIGEHVLRPCPDKPSPVKVCAISACGNFVVLGTASGSIERFNIQSGIRRGSYVDSSLDEASAHSGAVHGIASSSTNSCLFSAGYDTMLKVWDFKSFGLKSSLAVGSPVMKMSYHRGNGLVAVASDDHVLRLYDLVAVRLVRKFEGHTDRITDISFSEDGKWLLSSSMDGTVRVWDVVASKPLDAMHVNPAVTALSLSPSMDMLATCHVNHNGIYLWANRFMYAGGTDSEIIGSGKVIADAALPTFSSAQEELVLEETPNFSGGPNDAVEGIRNHCCLSAISQITLELVTLAMLPKTQWQGLVHLDTIKTRNKPTAAPKKPEKAPFFLPTLPSLSGVPIFAPGAQDMDNQSKENQSVVLPSTMKHNDFKSDFMQLVYKFDENGDCSELLEYIKIMPPPSLDAELRFMQIVDEDSSTISKNVQEIGMLIEFLTRVMSLNRDFELVQALTQLFLKVHGESILSHPYLRDKAKILSAQHGVTWQRLDSLFQNARCMISFLSNSTY